MNVYEAARERIAWCFAEFDYVYVSFSGGKDSGVLLELTAQVAQGRRFGIYHMDYEAQYQLTTDYVRETLDRFRDVADIYHICVPFKVIPTPLSARNVSFSPQVPSTILNPASGSASFAEG